MAALFSLILPAYSSMISRTSTAESGFMPPGLNRSTSGPAMPSFSLMSLMSSVESPSFARALQNADLIASDSAELIFVLLKIVHVLWLFVR